MFGYNGGYWMEFFFVQNVSARTRMYGVHRYTSDFYHIIIRIHIVKDNFFCIHHVWSYLFIYFYFFLRPQLSYKVHGIMRRTIKYTIQIIPNRRTSDREKVRYRASCIVHAVQICLRVNFPLAGRSELMQYYTLYFEYLGHCYSYFVIIIIILK